MCFTASIIGVLAEDGRPHRTWCGAEHGARWPRRTWRGAQAHPQAEGLRQESLLQMFGVQEFHEERPTEREAEMARPALPGDTLTLALPVSFCFCPVQLVKNRLILENCLGSVAHTSQFPIGICC